MPCVTAAVGLMEAFSVSMVDRHLSPDEKAEILSAWCEQQRMGAPGPGGLDPDMIPWCEKLNALPGVCSVQSCSGHSENGSLRSGHLWLRLDDVTSRAFDRAAFRLSANPHIEQVARLYSAWGEEITSITFAGNERNLLTESLQAIVNFFRSLQQKVTPTI